MAKILPKFPSPIVRYTEMYLAYSLTVAYPPNFSPPIAVTCMVRQNSPCQNFPMYGNQITGVKLTFTFCESTEMKQQITNCITIICDWFWLFFKLCFQQFLSYINKFFLNHQVLKYLTISWCDMIYYQQLNTLDFQFAWAWLKLTANLVAYSFAEIPGGFLFTITNAYTIMLEYNNSTAEIKVTHVLNITCIDYCVHQCQLHDVYLIGTVTTLSFLCCHTSSCCSPRKWLYCHVTLHH